MLICVLTESEGAAKFEYDLTGWLEGQSFTAKVYDFEEGRIVEEQAISSEGELALPYCPANSLWFIEIL
jgi:hypothetical protein